MGGSGPRALVRIVREHARDLQTSDLVEGAHSRMSYEKKKLPIKSWGKTWANPEQLLTMDILVLASMKNAANCDT